MTFELKLHMDPLKVNSICSCMLGCHGHNSNWQYKQNTEDFIEEKKKKKKSIL